MACATALATRSTRSVVQAEQLNGWRVIPTMQFSRRCTRMRRWLPPLNGTSAQMPQKTPAIAPASEDDSLRLRPNGRQSMLSRRSTSIMRLVGIDLDGHIDGEVVERRAPGRGGCDRHRAAGKALIASAMTCSL